jgi:hypothetical protein
MAGQSRCTSTELITIGFLALEHPARLWEGSDMNVDDLRLKLTAVFEPAPEGGFTSHFEELPEVFSQGETVEEAKANLLDALTLIPLPVCNCTI